MKTWLRQLDQILRGDATLMSSMRAGQIDVPIVGLSIVAIGLAAIYGVCMGSFGVLNPNGAGAMQMLASAVKVPLLFFLTLVVTFPSLYVFNALVGSRLSIASVLRLLVAMIAVLLAVLASLGPIVVFFSLSTTSYPFMKLLNVVVCATAGFLGLAFLLRTLHRLVLVQQWREEMEKPAHRYGAESKPEAVTEGDEQAGQAQPRESSAEDASAHSARANEGRSNESNKANAANEAGSDESSEFTAPRKPYAPSLGISDKSSADPTQSAARQLSSPQNETRGVLDQVGDRTSSKARSVFQIWIIVFALVGAQMSWVLRPFIGSPELPFAWFRERQGNFFQAVFTALAHLLH